MPRLPQLTGVNLVRAVVGRPVRGLKRHVFRPVPGDEDEGHGITELHVGTRVLAIGIGPNEAGIVVAEGPVARDRLDPNDWLEVTEDRAHRWRTFLGRRLEYVDLFGDDAEELALVFHLEGKIHFSVVLCDQSLKLARELEPFARRQRPLPRFVDRLH